MALMQMIVDMRNLLNGALDVDTGIARHGDCIPAWIQSPELQDALTGSQFVVCRKRRKSSSPRRTSIK